MLQINIMVMIICSVSFNRGTQLFETWPMESLTTLCMDSRVNQVATEQRRLSYLYLVCEHLRARAHTNKAFIALCRKILKRLARYQPNTGCV